MVRPQQGHLHLPGQQESCSLQSANTVLYSITQSQERHPITFAIFDWLEAKRMSCPHSQGEDHTKAQTPKARVLGIHTRVCLPQCLTWYPVYRVSKSRFYFYVCDAWFEWVTLGRLQSPAVWSNISIDVAGKLRFFFLIWWVKDQ